ncbi:ABC transporter substrate-binding protein [Halostagnicola sp. A-GB9-2]|uniref:ABC transporter substrate-binding protein n=1 Tax=Halostagnicola sp. A-GB9-2 TaxID=3048066 RepID=UPI0024BFACAA|nr:ABC transporter substrate-binding protein [Halostagnicola sp. A-GB9-2]MDJ1433320.1 ABC transporter substrate-binding protein [Halostagnicola sp. A-GB9-2]
MEELAPPTRRQLLAGIATATTGSVAGCMERFWSGSDENTPEQVSLVIKTVPTDDDYIAASILSQLRENLADAGIQVTTEPVAEREFYREILIQRDYDIFVGRHPGLFEPDALRDLLHSAFRTEEGWQNPFNFSNMAIDELLEKQHTSEGETREETLEELFESLEQIGPHSVVAFPNHLGGARNEVRTSWTPNRAEGYIDLLSTEPADGSRTNPLRVGLFGEGLSDRFNPIAADVGSERPLLELLYDPLARRIDGEYVPWLADDISWDDSGVEIEATVRLREGLTWHDGESLDASDVEFTIRFFEDTSLGEIESGVPTSQYRGCQSVVDSVSTVGARTVEFSFETPSEAVASRPLTVPILPEHVWESRSEPVGEYQTEARTTDNEPPIGSGLFRFGEHEANELLEFELFDDHVLLDPAVSDRPSILNGFPQYDGIEFHIVGPYPGVLIDMMADDDIDIIGADLPPEHAGSIVEESDVSMVNSSTDSAYIVGYNFQHPQLGDPRFRSLVSRLIDRDHVVEEVFDGYAEKPETYAELAGVRSPDDSSRSADGTASVLRFPGSDGEINQDLVRTLFEDEGYRYDDDTLLE